jgi:oligopeptide/dipeptide ABC transporter ATP-binding protein
MAEALPPTTSPVLEVRGLKKYYGVKDFRRLGDFGSLRSGVIHAVDDVSFHIDAGETLGLVGESGCGKTTAGRTILRLIEPTAGEVLFRAPKPAENAVAVFDLSGRRLRRLRRFMQMVFQDPYGSLNPRLTVGATLEEGLRAHRLGNRFERRERVAALLDRVGLDRTAAGKYPHAFSGGQRQRIGIARALAVDPVLLICDEPVSALDVSTQAQIVNLLVDLQRERNLAYLFIAHDLAVVAHISRRIAVMYQGQIVESALSADICQRPAHPYTRALLAAVPERWSSEPRRDPSPCRRQALPLTSGCRYQPRCPESLPECAHIGPSLTEIAPGHEVRCHLWKSPALADATQSLVSLLRTTPQEQ